MGETLVVDNAGYDVNACAKMSEKDFVEQHLPNDAIAKYKPEEERKAYLKDVYSKIKETANPKKEKPAPVNEEAVSK